MNYIRDNGIEQTPINGQFYKIFINLNKNHLPQMLKIIETNPKSQRNNYFQQQFDSAFTSFQSLLCGRN